MFGEKINRETGSIGERNRKYRLLIKVNMDIYKYKGFIFEKPSAFCLTFWKKRQNRVIAP